MRLLSVARDNTSPPRDSLELWPSILGLRVLAAALLGLSCWVAAALTDGHDKYFASYGVACVGELDGAGGDGVPS